MGGRQLFYNHMGRKVFRELIFGLTGCCSVMGGPYSRLSDL